MPSTPTHFLCLPLATPASLPQLKASLSRFAQDKAIQHQVSLKGAGARSAPRRRQSSDDSTDREDAAPYLPVKAIRPPGTLHLTLGVMDLADQGRLDAACAYLKSVRPSKILDQSPSAADSVKIVEGQPTNSSSQLVVQLRGLHAMQKIDKARVLYAEPHDSSERLLVFCKQLQDTFIKAGFIIEEGRDLKLHATIVNTLYASKIMKGKGKSGKLEFDASDLVERWKDEVWAEVTLTKLAICEMGAKVDDDGETRYKEIAEMGLQQHSQ